MYLWFFHLAGFAPSVGVPMVLLCHCRFFFARYQHQTYKGEQAINNQQF
jgi:hypothetical protein